jgi:hypothetical protein
MAASGSAGHRQAGLGLERGVGKRRQYFRFFLGKEFHHRLGGLRAAYYKLVARRFDAKSGLSRPAQES